MNVEAKEAKKQKDQHKKLKRVFKNSQIFLEKDYGNYDIFNHNH